MLMKHLGTWFARLRLAPIDKDYGEPMVLEGLEYSVHITIYYPPDKQYMTHSWELYDVSYDAIDAPDRDVVVPMGRGPRTNSGLSDAAYRTARLEGYSLEGVQQ